MASFDIGATGPVGPVQLNTVQPAIQTASARITAATQATSSPAAVTTTAASSTVPQVQTSLSIGAGNVPIDHTRVDAIRKAVQNGTYPLVPAKISDAMVAAGLMLRKTS